MEILFFMYGVKYSFIDDQDAFRVVTVFIFIMHYILGRQSSRFISYVQPVFWRIKPIIALFIFTYQNTAI